MGAQFARGNVAAGIVAASHQVAAALLVSSSMYGHDADHAGDQRRVRRASRRRRCWSSSSSTGALTSYADDQEIAVRTWRRRSATRACTIAGDRRRPRGRGDLHRLAGLAALVRAGAAAGPGAVSGAAGCWWGGSSWGSRSRSAAIAWIARWPRSATRSVGAVEGLTYVATALLMTGRCGQGSDDVRAKAPHTAFAAALADTGPVTDPGRRRAALPPRAAAPAEAVYAALGETAAGRRGVPGAGAADAAAPTCSTTSSA